MTESQFEQIMLRLIFVADQVHATNTHLHEVIDDLKTLEVRIAALNRRFYEDGRAAPQVWGF